MTIGHVENLLAYGGYIRSATDPSAVKRIAEIKTLISSTTIDKLTSQDQKNSTVTESSDNKSNTPIYDYRFLPNVPLSRPQESDKTFNETQKAKKKENDQKSFSDYVEEPESQEEMPVQDSTGKGYYIVLSDSTPPPEKKTSFNAQELVKERIINTYHLSRLKRNGTLVNLTF